jgi:hypothetical protein
MLRGRIGCANPHVLVVGTAQNKYSDGLGVSGMETIVAMNPGKFKSVVCYLNQGYLKSLFKMLSHPFSYIKYCFSFGWGVIYFFHY